MLVLGTSGLPRHIGPMLASICGFGVFSVAIGWLPMRFGLAQLRHLEI
jgi:hypothetical protein